MKPENKIKSKFKLHWIRFILWLFVYLTLLVYHGLYSFDELLVTSAAFAAFDSLALRMCSIAINRLIIPKFLYSKRVMAYIGLFVLLFIFSSLLIQLQEWVWYKWMGTLNARMTDVFFSFQYQLFNTYLTQMLGCMGISAFRLLTDYWGAQKRYDELQKEKAKTELDFLKAQLNPHFLFNSLNSLYAGIEKTNPVARNILLKFSEMLRYQLYECNADTISIEREITYLRNYIELEGLRKNDYLRINAEIDTLAGFHIAPLLLIPFVENAFKYASNHEDSENVVQITLAFKKPFLRFYCRNTRDMQLSRNLVKDQGLGIKNVKRRLELLYPGNYTLQINESEVDFEVELIIKLAT